LSNSSSSKDKIAEIIKLPSPILAYPSKEVLKKSKFFSKGKELTTINKASQRKSYAQVTGPNISEILKLRETIQICQLKRPKIFKKSSMTLKSLSHTSK